jgi:hypothetical protein
MTLTYLNPNRVHDLGIVDTIENESATAMTWLPLESKMLSSAAYDPEKQVLYLCFRDRGDLYRYGEFPVAEYQAFLAAESKGRFFLARIRDRFPYQRLAKLQVA